MAEDKEEPKVDAGKALNALSKSRRVVEMAAAKGKDTARSFELLEEASQALARADYEGCVDIAKSALRAIGEKKEEPPEEEGEKGAEAQGGDVVEKPAEEGDKKQEEGGKEYNIFLGQFKQKQDTGLGKYAGIVHVGLRTDGKSPAFIPTTPGAKPAAPKIKEPKGAPVVVERTLGTAAPRKVEIAVGQPSDTPEATKAFMAKHSKLQKPAGSEFLKKLKETPGVHGILETAEAKVVLDQLAAGAPAQTFPLPPDLHRLPFTHGVEMELQVIKRNGEWIEGSILESIFKHVVQFAHDILKDEFDTAKVPEPVRSKITRIWTQEVNEVGHIRGLVLMLEYRLDGKPITIELLGRDPHGVGVTWLMEGVTPPCEYVEELEWWVHQMSRLPYLGLQKLQRGYSRGELELPQDCTFNQGDADLVLVSAGLNPTQKFVTGISYGDHHHIGIPDQALRKEVYNLYRDYLPHFIALSVNSPVESGNLPDIKFSKNRIVASPLSYRLSLNEGQLCSGEANTHIPHLGPDSDVKFFIETTNKSDAESARLVEMFPFTRYGTIEVRIFDAQLTTQDRVGLALLLQALALKVSKLGKEGKSIPGVSSFALVENRKRVIKKGGLLGLKKDPKLEQSAPWFDAVYQGVLSENPEEAITRISHSIQNMFHLAADELAEIHPGCTYLDSFLISTFGGDKRVVDAPISQAQYQLYILDSLCKKNLADVRAATPSLVEHLAEIGRRVAAAKVYNPMVEAFGTPLAPGFLSPSGITFGYHVPGPVFGGQDILVSLKVNNRTDAAIADLKMETKVFNNRLKDVFEKWDTLGELAPGNERFFSIPVKTVPESTYFTIRSTVKQGDDKVLAVSTYHILVNQVFSSIAYAGAEGAEIKTPFHTVPAVLRIKQTSQIKMNLKAGLKLIKMGAAEAVLEQELDIEAPPEREIVLGPGELAVREDLREFYNGLAPAFVELKPAKPDKLGAGGQFFFEMTVTTHDGKVLSRSRSEPFLLGKAE